MTTIIVPFYGYLNSGIKRLWSKTKTRKKSIISISTHDHVGANIIGLDSAKQKLLYTKKADYTSNCLIINLNNLERFAIKKEYSSINAGELETKTLEYFLKNIFLQFVFKNGSGALSLPLFQRQKEQQVNIEQLEAQAKKWESIVSKLLPVKLRERA